MHRNWLETFAAWLNPQRDFAWAHDSRTTHRDDVGAGWDAIVPWASADDEDLIFYAALITAAHY